MKIKISVLLLVISLFTACIDKFSPKIYDYIDLPVVEGEITNEPGPYIVRLSRSVPFNSLDYYPITGANIVISDDLNTEELLVEVEPGIYSTDSFGIRGEVGRNYKITIKKGGKTYQSNFEELKEAHRIDSIYGKIEYKETREGSFEGMQFYIAPKNDDNKIKQILWVPVETYKYKADLSPDYVYWGATQGNFEQTQSDSLKVCWHTDRIPEIFTYSTNNLTEPNIGNFPLHYVDTKTKKLTEKYSLLVNQYTISKDAYRYWAQVKDQNEISGSLYFTQPFQIKGNLKNINNPDDIILGYFMVAGKTQKRIFINRPQLIFEWMKCEATSEALTNKLQNPLTAYPLYVSTVKSGDGFGLHGTTLSLGCYDCRIAGGTTTKPDFWED